MERALDHEREDRDLFLQAQEREQASRVPVWCRDDYPLHDRSDPDASGGQAAAERPWTYSLLNVSDATVHEVTVLFSLGGEHRLGTDFIHTLPPSASRYSVGCLRTSSEKRWPSWQRTQRPFAH